MYLIQKQKNRYAIQKKEKTVIPVSLRLRLLAAVKNWLVLQRKRNTAGNTCDKHWSRKELQQNFKKHLQNFVAILCDLNACRTCFRLCCVSRATPFTVTFTAIASFLTVASSRNGATTSVSPRHKIRFDRDSLTVLIQL